MTYIKQKKTGRATEAHDLLMACLRFAPRDSSGAIITDPAVPPVPYSEEWDDRDPVGFVMPPDRPYSSGSNWLWNTIATLPYCDEEKQDLEQERDFVVGLLRGMVDADGPDEYRSAVVAAVRWLATSDSHSADGS